MMTSAAQDAGLLVGFDGSPDAAAAIAVGARLLPGRTVRVAHVWSPPDPGSALHRRLAHHAWTTEHLERLAREEAAAAARLVAADGVALARAAGWTAEPVVREQRADGGADLAALADELRPAAVVVGSRGLGGVQALLGSVSEVVVHRSPVPVLVVPPLLADERAAATLGPVLVAHDGSAGAERAWGVAVDLFTGRPVVAVHVDAGPPGAGSVPADARVLQREGLGPAAVVAALAREAAAQRAAAIVIGSRRRSLLREVVLGSHTRAVLQDGHRPVLVVPDVG